MNYFGPILVRCLRIRHLGKCYILIFFIVLLNVCVIIWFQNKEQLNIDLRNFDINITERSRSSPVGGGLRQCIIPQLMNKSPLKEEQLPYKLDCNNSEPNWLNLYSGRLYYSDYVNSSRFNSHGGVNCIYVPLKSVDDYSTYYGEAMENVKNGSTINSDFFMINCKSSDDELFFEMLYAGVEINKTLQTERIRVRSSFLRSSKSLLNYNVVILGIDSVSRLAFQKYLPESYSVFKHLLSGVEFSKYNIIGDGTTPNLLAMLTGSKETELYESRRTFKNADFVDFYPWIWNDFKKAGYITQWTEEGAKYGTFQHRLKGFKSQPTHHYMRPYFLRAESYFYEKYKWGCMGSKPRHQVTLDWLREAYRGYSREIKKLSFIFLSELSHENNYFMSPLDKDLKDLLLEFQNGRLFQESILILMSDHGHRYATSRSTFQGKYEERLPFLGISLPPSLRSRYPNIQRNVHSNSDQLVTLFDVHATLKSILMLDTNKSRAGSEASGRRGISLFYKFLHNRTCADIGIDEHWCACLKWTPLSADNHRAYSAAMKIVDAINSITVNYRHLCTPLGIERIISAEVYYSSKPFLLFKKSHDLDGRIAEFSDRMKCEQYVYRINLITQPGLGEFEATIYFNTSNRSWFTNSKYISRTNQYSHLTKCLTDTFPELSKFCVCGNR